MNSIVERMEKEFGNFMKRYREMDADEFIKELEEAGVSFIEYFREEDFQKTD